MPGTVLYVAHGFPPAGGSGPNRALAFARYLPAFGWRPVVLTTGREWAANRDDALLAELPAGARVVRTRSLEPRPAKPSMPSTALPPMRSRRRRELRSVGWLKRQVGHARRFPDAHLGWTPFAVAAGLRTIRHGGVDALYSTAGPYTAHLVGLILHRLAGLPWLAELRDGWYEWNRAIFPDYPRWRGWLEPALEAAVVRGADRVVLVTQQMAEAFRRQYPSLPPQHFATIPNGFDPGQYATLRRPTQRPDAFVVAHAGSLYYGRSIAALLEAAGQLAGADPAFRQAFRLRLAGSMDVGAQREIARLVQRYGLQECVQHLGYLEHRETLAELVAAHLLLLVVNTTRGAEAAVPGKLFEYLAVGRPILAIAPPGAEAAAIVRDTRAGWVAAADDVDQIAGALRAAFQAVQGGARTCPDQSVLARFDRRRQARALACLLDEVAAPWPGR